jgi:hypothetical protein
MAIYDPDKYFSRITHIDVKHDLLARGIKYALLDADNTIVSRATHAVPHDVAVWLESARAQGVSMCLLSNNWHQSIYERARELDLPVVAKACKPLVHGYVFALRKIGADRRQTVCIGDQLFTDVVGAHLAGMKAYLVQPLVEEDLKHTLMLRNVERALLGGRVPEPAASSVKISESE